MLWLKEIFCRAWNFIKQALTKRTYRECAIIVAGIAVLAVVVLGAAGFSGGGKNKVYAVQNSKDKEAESGDEENIPNELQAGLMGVVNSVTSLEEYSAAASSKSIENAHEDVLVGNSKASKGALNRISVEKGLTAMSGIGYISQLAVRQHQMPVEDYYALLQIVEAEATGGDTYSKMLVANVVLNRVEDSHFPDNIYDVVWQTVGGSPQFSPTSDGRIYSVDITDSTIEAVDRALDGEDNSKGALFFIARSSADEHNAEWFDDTLEWMFEYGGHEYYKFAE